MATTRTWKQAAGAIWASTASIFTPGTTTPVQSTSYRNPTADSNPSADPGYLTGFNYLSKSPSEIANQVLFNLSSALDDLQTHGTIGWESTTAYPAGALCHGSDNKPYVCVVANTGQDPTSTTGYWMVLPPVPYTSFMDTDTANMGNGLIHKWGIVNGQFANNASSVVVFGTAFPHACLNVSLTGIWTIDNNNGSPGLLSGSKSATGFTMNVQGDSIGGFEWLAIGY